MSAHPELNDPIICVGGPRSGTTMLMQFFEQVAEVRVLVGELNTLWRTGNRRCPHDRFTADMATPSVVRRIRKTFVSHQRAAPDKRLFEKTPRNVLRIPFVHKVLPEARLIHIYRDGRDTVSSCLGYWMRPQPLVARDLWFRVRNTPLRDWLAYVPRFFHEYLGVRLGLVKRAKLWGLAYPGVQDDLAVLSPAEIAAKQWVTSIHTARSDLAQLDPALWIDVRYEDLVADPLGQFGRILDFVGLEMSESVREYLGRTIYRAAIGAYRKRLTPEEIATIEPILGPTMRELGYTMEEPA